MAMKDLVTPRKPVEASKERQGFSEPEAGHEEHMAPPALHLDENHMKALGWKPKAGARHIIHAEVVVHHVGAKHEDQGANPPSGGKIGEATTKHTATLHFHKMDVGGKVVGDGAKNDADHIVGAKAAMDKALAREAGGKKAGEGESSKAKTPRANNVGEI